MWDNWIKGVEDIFSYQNFKKEVQKWNKIVVKFWNDAYNDFLKDNKKK